MIDSSLAGLWSDIASRTLPLTLNEARHMKIATYNIQFGVGRDGRYDLPRAVAAVSDADIIAFQEVERGWQRTGYGDQPVLIEQLLPDRFAAYAPFFDRHAHAPMPDGWMRHCRRQFGVMTVSRWPILWARPQILPKHDGGAAFNLETGFLETVIATPCGVVRVVNLHLGHLSEAERLVQIAAIQARFDAAGQDGGPWNGSDADTIAWEEPSAPPRPVGTLMLGDFNAGPGSRAFAAAQALRDPQGQSFCDAWAVAHAPGTPDVTYFANPSQGAEEDDRIDHIFLAGEGLCCRWAAIDAAAAGSDHQPVFAAIGTRSSPA